MDHLDRRSKTARFEAALWIIMGGLAFLAKNDPSLEYPQVLYMFAGMMLSNLSTSLALRYAPEKTWLHALTFVASFAAIAGVQEWSGGRESTLWVLYLMPLFSAAILLDGSALLWTAAGACASNAALYVPLLPTWDSTATFELGLKTGMLVASAAALWFLAGREREAEARIRLQRREIEHLEESSRATAAAWERERGLHSIAAASARAAHDLGTPLMVIRSYAKLHLTLGVQDTVLERDLGRIESAAAFCIDLTKGLLGEAGEIAAPKRLSTVVDAAINLAEPILRSRQVQVNSSAPADLRVSAPSQDVERILLNLLGNAAKAMSNGGRILVSARREIIEGRELALVTIEDDGPGIPGSVLSRLFQPFSTTGGTGLGLYLSRETARRLEGDLLAENRKEGGARFTLLLPLTPAPVAAAEAAATVEARS